MFYNFKIKNYLIFLIILCSCNFQENDEKSNLTNAIPINSNVIIKFHNIHKMKEKLDSFKWWGQLKDVDFIELYIHKLETLNSEFNLNELFHNKHVYVSSVLFDQYENNILLTTSMTEFQAKSNKLMHTIHSSDNKPRYYEGIQINNIKIGRNNLDVFFAKHLDVFMLSFSSIAIEESIRQLKNGQDLFKLSPINKLDKNLPKYSDVNILVKTKTLEKIIGHNNIFLNSNTWSWFDVELEKNYILLNGVTNRGDIKYLLDSEYNNAKKSTIENVLPRHTAGFYSYQIKNESDLNEVINAVSKGAHKNIYHLQNTWYPTEINIAYENLNKNIKSYIICKPKSKKKALSVLKNESQNIRTKYLDYEIIELSKKKFPQNNWLHKLIFDWNKLYYVYIEENIIFSDSIKKIKSLINNMIAEQTIGKNKSIQTINNKLGNKSHTSFYLDFKNYPEKWKSVFNSIVSKNIASKEYFFNSIILLHENKEFQNPTAWNTNLNTGTNYKPQLVLNHYTDEFEVLCQDIKNQIYLINKKGDILWNKHIGSTILGDVHQIDAYKNSKLQYLFNTKDSIYLIDRNGDEVSPFPIASSHIMSIPLAVFDYDNNRNYRILVAMSNTLKMYNQKGKIITGWEFKKTESKILYTPEHYQVFNKDYIIISEENGQTHLLNRKGQARTFLKSKIYRSKNPISLIQGTSISNSKLISSTTNGEVLYIFFDGTIDTLKIHNFKETDHYINKNGSSITMKDKKMSFSSKQNRFEYIFKNPPLSIPKIMEFGDSIIIGIRNQNENLIYLFNDNGTLYGEPFFGTTDFSIGELTEKGKLNLLVGSQEGLIYNYKIN